MIDHIILTVSNVERSLAFYEAALAPLDIKFFMPYKREERASRSLGIWQWK
jgi:catechol 2,3-dioxygenase-like lactoylglutathione lyase family enzyme